MEDHDIRFNRRFAAFLATLLIVFACGYLVSITFGMIPEKNLRFADTALGFVLGTMLAVPIGFYFGASKTQQPTPPAVPVSTDPKESP